MNGTAVRKRKKKKKIFYPVYFSLLALSVILIAAGLIYLSGYLDDYEASLPKYVAEQVTEKYFSPVDYGLIFDTTVISLSKYETREDYIRVMTDNFGNGCADVHEVTAGLSGNKKYVAVSPNGKKIAEFYLKRAGKSGYGFDLWELEGIYPSELPTNKVRISMIRGGRLEFAGVTASDTDILEAGIETPSCSHVPEGVLGTVYDTYEFRDLIAEHTFSVLDPEGEEAEFVFDSDTETYIEQPKRNRRLEKEFSELVIGAAQTYAKYMTRDTYAGALSEYFDTESNTYRLVKNSDTWCYSEHLGYEFVDVTTGEYTSYGDDVFSARYTCTHNVFFTARDTRVFELDLTMYFRRIGDGFFVYDLVTNS